MSETNSMSAELVTILTVHILIDEKDILPDVFRNEEIAKGVIVSGTQVEPRSVYALNETTFLVTYPLTYQLLTLVLLLTRLMNGWVNL